MDVLIVDDHTLFRVGLEMLLVQLLPAIRIEQAADVAAARALQLAGRDFELVLMDWQMPCLSGVAALRALRDCFEGARIVVLSGKLDAQVLRDCLDHGASGILHKDSSSEQLAQAVASIAAGQFYLPPSARPLIDSAAAGPPVPQDTGGLAAVFPELTQRQCEVFLLMARGLTNKLIARDLGIAGDTVKQHLSLIYQTLGVHNRTEAVYMIAQRGLRLR